LYPISSEIIFNASSIQWAHEKYLKSIAAKKSQEIKQEDTKQDEEDSMKHMKM
jgi:hypothetical protein